MPLDGFNVIGRRPVTPDATSPTHLWRRLKALASWALRDGGIKALEYPMPDDGADPDVARLLMAAAARIESRSRWIQGSYRTFGGRYCAMGALQAAGMHFGHATRIRARHALVAVARANGYPTVERMNDNSTHDRMVAAFDTAIANVIMQRLDARLPRRP